MGVQSVDVGVQSDLLLIVGVQSDLHLVAISDSDRIAFILLWILAPNLVLPLLPRRLLPR